MGEFCKLKLLEARFQKLAFRSSLSEARFQKLAFRSESRLSVSRLAVAFAVEVEKGCMK